MGSGGDRSDELNVPDAPRAPKTLKGFQRASGAIDRNVAGRSRKRLVRFRRQRSEQPWSMRNGEGRSMVTRPTGWSTGSGA